MSYLKNTLYIWLSMAIIIACSSPKEESDQTTDAIAIDEVQRDMFDPSKSDKEAVKIVEGVIEAHGGQEAWENTRYIGWNFLGSRDLVWDKYTGLVRIDFPKEQTTYIINILQDTGNVMLKNKMILSSDSIKYFLERGKQIWVNDSYWLVFPFKLKDPGVELSYLGMDSTKNGLAAEVVSLEFNRVGFTPENKYKVYVDPKSKLILQWDYFSKASDSLPAISNVWSAYDQYGDIMLSGGRDDRKLGNIQISQAIDSAIFEF